MDKDKSIIEKFTETVKGLADSAAEALKAEEPPKADETAAAYMPFAAEGLVSDPLVPPVTVQPVRKKKRAKKSARKSANKSAPSRSSKAAKKSTAAKAARKTAKTKTTKGKTAGRKTGKKGEARNGR